jgi:hypothetical protein
MRRQWFGVVVILGAIGFLGASPALAQVDQVSVKVPFSFMVGSVSLPAGAYRVAADGANPAVMMVANADGRGQAAVLTDWAAPFWAEGGAALVFKKIEGKYYLAAIRITGEDTREVVLPELPEPAAPHHES